MKQLTSGTDPMSCRAPYGQLMKFTPQANAIIMANHFLEIKSRDHGTWRRVRVIEFKSLFTDEPVKGDKYKPFQFKKVDNLDAKFDEWKEVFMGLLVEKAFQNKGIVKICSMVSAASNQYRQNQDFLAEFIHDKIMKREGCYVKKGELNSEFKDWYNLNYGYSKLNKTKELHGCMDKLFGNYSEQGWKGVAINYEHDDNSSARFTDSNSLRSGGSGESVASGTDNEDNSSSRKFSGL
jgi:phage/plasmid-associated DNA primase